MTYKATKIVIITEQLIGDGVKRIIEEVGASGYTMVSASGKGSRGVRPAHRPVVVEGLANIKIEVICASREMAEQIADRVAETYFENYSGITYLEEVEILRPHKF